MKINKYVIILISFLIVSIGINIYLGTKTLQLNTVLQEKEYLIIENQKLFDENRLLKRDTNDGIQLELNHEYIVGQDIAQGEYILYLNSNETQEFKIILTNSETGCKLEEKQTGKFEMEKLLSLPEGIRIEITGNTEGQWLSLVSKEVLQDRAVSCPI